VGSDDDDGGRLAGGQSVGQSKIFLDAGALPLFTMLH